MGGRGHIVVPTTEVFDRVELRGSLIALNIEKKSKLSRKILRNSSSLLKKSYSRKRWYSQHFSSPHKVCRNWPYQQARLLLFWCTNKLDFSDLCHWTESLCWAFSSALKYSLAFRILSPGEPVVTKNLRWNDTITFVSMSRSELLDMCIQCACDIGEHQKYIKYFRRPYTGALAMWSEICVVLLVFGRMPIIDPCYHPYALNNFGSSLASARHLAEILHRLLSFNTSPAINCNHHEGQRSALVLMY